MTLFWPDLPQSSAGKNLRQSLYRLRQVIPELPARDGDGSLPFLLADRQTVQINPDATYDLDVLTFTALLRGPQKGWPEAVCLYRGDFLPDFYLPDSAPFEEWVAARRADLRRRALAALDALTAASMNEGDLETAEQYARQQLAIDDLRESAHRQLMELLARRGQRSEALTQYETLSQLFNDELAVEPSAASRAIYEAIRSGKLDQAVLPSSPPTLVSTARKQLQKPHNLPSRATPFFGREAELRALSDFATHPEVRLVTIVGPGGVGKTWLALETARRQMDNFAHGAWFTSLTRLSSPDEIVPATAQALNFSFYEGGTPRQQLLDYLRNKSLLLLMDNYEHLLAGVDLVSDILQNAPQIKILATSREPLRLVEEQLFPLDGLAFTREEVVEGDAAVQLFLGRAQRLRPDLALETADIPYVTAICRQLEGLPLGLVLAAAWTDTLSLADIAAEVQQSLDLLETDMRNIPERHRSMRAVFDVSWMRLQTDERQIFAQTSIFRGGFTRSAVQHICAPDLSQRAFLRLLASLTRKSFLKYETDSGRYDIHELMRQYGARKLAEDSEQDLIVRDRHAAYYCEFLHQLGEDLKGPRQKEAAKEIEADLENGRAAWNWAINRKMFDHLQKIVLFWDHFLVVWRSRHQEADSLYGTLVKSLTGNDTLLARQLLIQALLCRAGSTKPLGQFEEAAQLHQRAQELFLQPPINELENWPGKSFVLRCLGLPDIYKHTEWCQQGLDLARRTRDRWEECVCLLLLGGTASAQGRFDGAEEFLEEALTIGRLFGDRLICAEALLRLSHNAHQRYRFEKAEQLANESLALFRDLEDQGGVAESLHKLGHIYLYSGRYAQAIKAYRDRLQLYEEIGSHIGIAWSHYWLSHTYLHAGEYARSKAAAETYLSMVRGAQFDRAIGLTMLGNNALIEGDHSTAASCFAESEAIMRTTAGSVVLAWYRGYHVVTLVHCEELDEARQVIFDALDVKALAPTCIILFAGIALLHWAEKRWERAIELYALACTNPYAGKSQWVADVVGRRIDEAAASLPQDVVEAARIRGKEMDMWETAVALLAELSEQD
jgi:predicted ATPase/DNA-binding SARP family transcriptional activator